MKAHCILRRLAFITVASAALSGCGWLGLADGPGAQPVAEKPAQNQDAPRYEAAPLPSPAFFQ